MKSRKILSLVLSLIIITGMFSFASAAEEVYPDACITVPSDVTLFVGEKSGAHFVDFTEIIPTDKTETEEAVNYYFELEDEKTYNYRITSENYITYAGKFTKAPDFTLSITEEMLGLNGTDKKKTDTDVFSNNGFNVADIYLNINPQGHLKLSTGETYQLVNLRNWEAVNSTTANYFIEPDYHYTVIDENGAECSVITVNEDGLITANESGTAIVLVTYDAINLNYDEETEFYGAIWPENTGVFVVSVDAVESDINANMTLNNDKNSETIKLSGNLIDAEHDCIYYMGESGSYTFSPVTQDCNVFIANPIIDTSLSYNGFEEISKSEDGSFTVPLTEGRNIVKITSGESSNYQIITAKQVSITINDGNEVKAGDKISIVFDSLYHPANKLAGVYNMSAVPMYTDVSGYEEKIIGAISAQYDFASNAETQNVCNVLKEEVSPWGSVSYEKDADLIVPADYNEDTFTLSGGTICVSGYGDAYGNHRGITYETGKAPNFSAEAKVAWLGQLPDIEIPIAKTIIEDGGTNNDGDDSSPSSPETIDVFFTLYGDEKHGEAENTHTMKKGNLTEWIEKTSFIVDENSFVIDVVKKALDGKMTYIYDNYLSSVNGLGEFDNGKNSGWMYMLNGEYALYGMNEQKLKDGDEIVVYYTDDFMAEYSLEDENEDNEEASQGSSGKRKKNASVVTTLINEVQEEIKPQFKDISEKEWYSEAVNYVTSKGLMNGVSENEFAPEDCMTRAMLVTVLYRMDNSKNENSNNIFTDIKNDMWYTDAVMWAYDNGIVNGVSETSFAPDENVTREQMAAIIYRYAEFKKIDTSNNETLSKYTDAESVSEWAKVAMQWANASGLINGTDNSSLSPCESATRSQVAAILMRFNENFLKTE